MEVILIEDVPNLGGIGDQVKVKAGYARNYLLPQKMAIPASVKNQRRLEHEKRLANFRLEKAKKEAGEIADLISKIEVVVRRKVGEQGKLYGSVTALDIERALNDQDINLDRRKLGMSEPIKAVGVYDIPVRLRENLTAELKVLVEADTEDDT